MNTVQSWGSRLRTWLEDNDIEITFHYQFGDVQYNHVVGGRPNRNRSPPRIPPPEGADLGPAATLAVVGITAGIFALAAASSGVESTSCESGNPTRAMEDEVLSHCADVVITKLKGEPESCTVCMEEMKIGDRILILPCIHKFHKDCILTWLRQSGKCSECRTSITARTEEEPHSDPEL